MSAMLPGDPSLPPGVSERDFREGPDNCSECGGEGVVDFSNCCGAELWGNWLQAMRCPECHEACERDLCPSCEGSGTDEPKGDAERVEDYGTT